MTASGAKLRIFTLSVKNEATSSDEPLCPKRIPIRIVDPIDPLRVLGFTELKAKMTTELTSLRQRHRHSLLSPPPVILQPRRTLRSLQTTEKCIVMRRLWLSILFSFIPSSSYVGHPFSCDERCPPCRPTLLLVSVTLTNDSQIRRLRNDTRERFSLPLDLPSTCTYARSDDGVRTHTMD